MKRHPQAPFIGVYALLHILTLLLLISVLGVVLLGGPGLAKAAGAEMLFAFLVSGALLIIVAIIIRCPICGQHSCIDYSDDDRNRESILSYYRNILIDRSFKCLHCSERFTLRHE
jgi:hypothetical protein